MKTTEEARDPAGQSQPERPPDAVIVAARLGAGHDGRAEAVLEVRYPNGAVRSVTVGQEAMATAMDAAGIARLDGVVGRSWTLLLGERQDRRGGT